MKERDFQSRFTKWLKYRFNGTGAFELKICKEKSMPFNAVQEHQINALFHAKHGSLEYKIPDGSFAQSPFDCFKLERVSAFVVVMFYKHGQNAFIMIDIDDFMQEMNTSSRKSLTEDRARQIGQEFFLE